MKLLFGLDWATAAAAVVPEDKPVGSIWRLPELRLEIGQVLVLTPFFSAARPRFQTSLLY